MNHELGKILKYLRLSNLLARWDDYIQMATKQRFSAVRLLQHVVEEEYRAKRANARERRIKLAKIPEIFVMETFPFKRQPKLDKKTILSIYDAFDFVENSQNIVWLGPTKGET